MAAHSNERDASLISLRLGRKPRREHFTRKRLIVHVCPGIRPQATAIDANNAIARPSLDHKREGHGVLERGEHLACGSTSSQQHRKFSPLLWASIMDQKERGRASSEPRIPTSTSRLKPGMGSKKRRNRARDSAERAGGARPLAASHVRIGIRARRNCRPRRKREGLGNCGWHGSSVSSSRCVSSWSKTSRPAPREKGAGIKAFLRWK